METMRERLVGGRGRRMTGPDRIWIDRHGGNWSPVDGGAQDVEYIRRDPAVLDALPEVQAMIAAAAERVERAAQIVARHKRYWEEVADEIRNLTPADATAALARIEREAEARGMRKAAEDIAKWHLEEGWKLDVDDVPAAILARAAEIEKDAK